MVILFGIDGYYSAGTGASDGTTFILVAEMRVGVKPRIIGAPGLDTLAVANQIAIFARELKAFAYISMPGSVAVDLGFEAGVLDMELTLGGLAPELMKLWGTPTADGMQFRFAGSYQAEDRFRGGLTNAASE
ncbi:phage major tail tube protein [Yersinia mollaretii]|uniref:phage major tail tube protein n=1 Tax=Yersinia mollaretii TaxID=33060 RepID=UPI0021BD40D7|nr:phage major tail tube protein [Yersinia mollaretii]